MEKEVLQPLKDVCREADGWVASFPSDQLSKIPCKKGCAWCCHQFLEITIPEAILLVLDLIDQKTDPEKFERWCRVVERRAFREMAVCNRASAREDAWKELCGIPCVFLKRDKSCLAYQSRPVMCRTYFMLEGPSVCESRQVQKIIGRAWQVDNHFYFERSQRVAQRIAEAIGVMGDLLPMAVAVRWALIGALDGEERMREFIGKEASERKA